MTRLNSKGVIFILLFLCSLAVQAQPGTPIDGPEQHCYGLAMVGYDSVINARLGVPAEQVIDLAKSQKVANTNTFEPYLLKVVLDAYLWENSPHNYAVRVMYNCAKYSTQIQTAAAGLPEFGDEFYLQ